MKDIEQNSKGTKFCAPYIDDGVFMMRIFDKYQKGIPDEDDVQNLEDKPSKSEININKLIGIDDSTMPNQGFSDPYIVATFCNDDESIFVNLFHNGTKTHYHFIYDLNIKSIK